MDHPGISALVLAAGKGTRMKSPLPKPIVPVQGRAIVLRLLDALRAAGIQDLVVVVGHRAPEIQATLGPGYRYVMQTEQKGMAHAVAMAQPVLADAAHVIVMVGDSPLLRPSTVERLLAHHLSTGSSCTFLTAIYDDPPPYARVIRDASGRVVRCVEQWGATDDEKKVRELLTSHYVFQARALWEHLGAVEPHPVTGELYLTDIIGILLASGHRVEAIPVADPDELVGLNSLEEVAWAERILEGRSA